MIDARPVHLSKTLDELVSRFEAGKPAATLPQDPAVLIGVAGGAFDLLGRESSVNGFDRTWDPLRQLLVEAA